jgi:hypothetical protein
MKPKEIVSSILEKEMNRKEFLMHLGAGAITLIGISSLLKTLNSFGTKKGNSDDYGSSAYGGVNDKSK